MENDPIVTLLDGTKIRKSEVPVDVVYINEEGKKVKKVIKKAAAAPQPTGEGFFSGLAKKAAAAGKTLSETAKTVGSTLGETAASAGETISQTAGKVGSAIGKTAAAAGEAISQGTQVAKEKIADGTDDLTEFAALKIKGMVGSIHFDETLAALDKYQAESGKDVSALRKFIVELQKFAQDGSK